MFLILFIGGIIIYIIYRFFSDRDDMLKHQVDMQGGMQNKYSELISHLLNHPTAKIVKTRRDMIYIRATARTTAYNYIITETFNQVVIEWVGQMSMYGTHKNKWSFPHNYPQEKIIKEIQDYQVWKSNEIFGPNI